MLKRVHQKIYVSDILSRARGRCRSIVTISVSCRIIRSLRYMKVAVAYILLEIDIFSPLKYSPFFQSRNIKYEHTVEPLLKDTPEMRVPLF